MSSEPTPDEIRRVVKYLDRESDARAESAQQSRNGFFGWLREKGFSYIVEKIFDYAWASIRRLFFGF
jgi:hypothetical protein